MKSGKLKVMFAAVLLLCGCGWEPLPAPAPVAADKVFIMYDNIGAWFDQDVAEAGAAVASGALDADERLIVYERGETVGGTIYELIKDGSSKSGYSKRLWKQYESGENATLSEETIRSVVGDIRSFIPAPHYGLAFGSHGTGWIPRSSDVSYSRRGSAVPPTPNILYDFLWNDRDDILTRYLAYSRSEKIDVGEFADALDGEPGAPWEWDFIIFDDCFMACVEALYEIRHLARYFIASPTEIMGDGFPYDRIVSAVFNDWSDVGRIGREFIDYYTNVGGQYPCGTIAVVRTDRLEALTETIRRLGLRENELATSADVAPIQHYENITNPAHIFYDLDDYLSTIRAETMPAEYNAFVQQLAEAIVYKGHTDYFFSDFGNRKIHVDHYSGLNVFIPWSGTSSFFSDYRQTEWYKTVYAVE